MKRALSAFALACMAAVTLDVHAAAAGSAPPPAWAYPVNPPDFRPRVDDGILRRVPGSTAAYSVTQLTDRFFAPDWHPQDHPPMPAIVAHGRKPDVYACGCCHRADGPGGPENASLAGLPAQYIVQQMQDFKSGARSTALPARVPQALMISLAKGITDEEVRAAAEYFAALPPRANVAVVETDSVPKTSVSGWFLTVAPSGGSEPLGQRIVEVPEVLEQHENRDTHSRFIAYVPIGSIARGRELVVAGGGGRTLACTLCHGADLRGAGQVPRLRGRSPSYITRQLYDMQAGFRRSDAGAVMQPVVAQLDADDMIAVSAYLASLSP